MGKQTKINRWLIYIFLMALSPIANIVLGPVAWIITFVGAIVFYLGWCLGDLPLPDLTRFK